MPQACKELLAGLLSRHRPQALTYEGNGAAGASYTNSWRISTYAHTEPHTYVHQMFQEKYGAPFDAPMRAYMDQAGITTLLEDLKRQFLATLARRSGLDDAELQRLRDTRLAQLFFTVQPDAPHMNAELDTYMQPHYDPSELTINVHLSPLDWQGCLPAENGLRVFAAEHAGGSRVFATPAGTVAFIWQVYVCAYAMYEHAYVHDGSHECMFVACICHNSYTHMYV